MYPQNFRTTPFTQEELSRFTVALSKGRVNDIVSLVSEMSPEKEIEIQKLINHFSPIFKGYEQKVKGFLDLLQTKESLQISEPQQEARIQELIDKELTSVKNRNKLEAAISELNSLKTASQEEIAKVQDTIKEHKKMLKELEISLAEDVTLENVRDILKNVTVVPERVITPPILSELSVEKSVEPVVELVEKEEKTEPEKAVLDDVPPAEEGVKTPVEEADLRTEQQDEAEKQSEESVVKEDVKLEEEVKKDVEESRESSQEEDLKVGDSSAKSCCGSEGNRHKKNCPIKNK